MSKKSQPTNVSKLINYVIDPPDISFIAKTSEYQFESLDKTVHLPSPSLLFSHSTQTSFYAGVPVYMMSIATNTRFNNIKGALLSIQVIQNEKTIFQAKMPSEVDISPQHTITFPYRFVIENEGEASVVSQLSFQFDGISSTISSKSIFHVFPSILVKVLTVEKPPKYLQVSIENKMPISVVSVEASTTFGESIYISDIINPEESVSGIIPISQPLKGLDVFFSVPYQQKCVQKLKFKDFQPKPIYPISISFCGIPRSQLALKPFIVDTTITNITNVPISGKMAIAEINDSIFLFGNNDLSIPALEPGSSTTRKLEFVAVKEGSYSFPSFDFELAGFPSTRLQSETGLLIIGVYNK